MAAGLAEAGRVAQWGGLGEEGRPAAGGGNPRPHRWGYVSVTIKVRNGRHIDGSNRVFCGMAYKS
jgi:hypothetical protein